MKEKGNNKHTKIPNFWSRYDKIVPAETKEFIFNQFYDLNTLYVYCDATVSKEKGIMAIASSYLNNGSIVIKNSLIYIEKDLVHYPIYGEFKAIQFVLKNVEKHIINYYKKVIIYSDLVDIEGYMNNNLKIKVEKIEKLKQELILEYNKLCSRNKNLEIKIEYLPTRFHKHNPFYRSAHNAARKMLEDSK